MRIRETFAVMDQNGDKLLDGNDLRKVLLKIRAPKSYVNQSDDIIWEVNDNNKKNYLERRDVERVVRRVLDLQLSQTASITPVADASRNRNSVGSGGSSSKSSTSGMSNSSIRGKEPTRLVNILDFVSSDRELTGYITTRQCIVLLLNRFGSKVKSIDGVRSPNSATCLNQSKVSFRDYLAQIEIHQNIISIQ